MATIQARKSRGRKYWYIVESRRVNGKPRPITLAYLGKADDLLKRLNGLTEGVNIKSYSHGAVAALLKIADELNICEKINQHVESERTYTSKKPIRNHLTVGATLLFAAIGRICEPTSKASWADWANTTSLSYLTRTSLSKVDSQHFWDLMDALPEKTIEKIEESIVQAAFKQYGIDTSTLFYDTTNFFTYIHTTNDRCDLAKRGRNKQKRMDLRQIGLALVVSEKEKVPLFHLAYEGNRHDSKIFTRIIEKVKSRLESLGLSPAQHTLVFDRGNNSKNNFALLTTHGLHYVGALVPYQHRTLVSDAINYFEKNKIETIYREKQAIWGEERTIVVFISDALKVNQLSWLHDAINKIETEIRALQTSLQKKRRKLDVIKTKIAGIIKKYEAYIDYELAEQPDGKHQLTYSINNVALEQTEDACGFRILMTNRHDWPSEKIIQSYHGQSHIENAFRDLKNPFHLAVRPQYHWTDQKLKVHFFTCVMGYLLASILKQQVSNVMHDDEREIATLIHQLNNIRLGTILEDSKTQGKMKAHYKLEETNKAEKALIDALALEDFHQKRSKLSGLSVYN